MLLKSVSNLHVEALVVFSSALILLVADCKGAIAESLKTRGKSLPTDKQGTSAEERVIDAINPAIANVGLRHGYHTLVKSGNGSWKLYEGNNKVRQHNSIPEHSAESEERMQNAADLAVEANWDGITQLMKGTESGEKRNETELDLHSKQQKEKIAEWNPFRSGSQIVEPMPIRKEDSSQFKHKSDVMIRNKSQWQTTMLEAELRSALTKKQEAQALSSILIGAIFLLAVLVGLIFVRKYKHASLFKSAKGVVIKPRISVAVLNSNGEGNAGASSFHSSES